MKKKKKKVNKKKFFSRIFLLLAILFIIIFIVTRPSKKEIPKFEIAIIINNKNITNDLVHAPYINLNNVLYLSVEDVGNIFDKNIYFEAETRKIITTTNTKVAALDVINNTLEINNASLNLDAGALDYGENQYMPITELSKIYNIESLVTEKTAVISSLNNELITLKPTKKIKLKEEMSGFSRTLKKLDEGEELIFIEEAEKKNWLKVLTYDRKYRIYQK